MTSEIGVFLEGGEAGKLRETNRQSRARIGTRIELTTATEKPEGTVRNPMTAITRDEVAHLAKLSRLALHDEELDTLAVQLDEIISSVAKVQEVVTDDTPPSSHALPLTNVYRPDESRTGLTPEQALGSAPAVQDQRFRVPRILGEEE